MKILLDTCTIIYSLFQPEKLSSRIKEVLQESDTEVHVSVISLGEIACLAGKKIHFPRHWRNWFKEAAEAGNWIMLSVDYEVMEEAYSLPELFHRDPADRILVATSRLKQIPLVTNDRLITDYPFVKIYW